MAIVQPEGLGKLKNAMPSWKSNRRPFGLYHRASTNYATTSGTIMTTIIIIIIKKFLQHL
jgi:hypothetical protein